MGGGRLRSHFVPSSNIGGCVGEMVQYNKGISDCQLKEEKGARVLVSQRQSRVVQVVGLMMKDSRLQKDNNQSLLLQGRIVAETYVGAGRGAEHA